MIPLRSRSDSFTFTPELSAIASGSNFSRCPSDHQATKITNDKGESVRLVEGAGFHPTGFLMVMMMHSNQ
jgi:hypothetical protein